MRFLYNASWVAPRSFASVPRCFYIRPSSSSSSRTPNAQSGEYSFVRKVGQRIKEDNISALRANLKGHHNAHIRDEETWAKTDSKTIDDKQTSTLTGNQSVRSAKKSRHNQDMLLALVEDRFVHVVAAMKKSLLASDFKDRPFGLRTVVELERSARVFRDLVRHSFMQASRAGLTSRTDNPLFWNIRNAFIKYECVGLSRELRYAFQSCLAGSMPGQTSLVDAHHKLADMRFPYEWFPEARSIQRTVHLHVGPTNSGKTYNALKALEAARTGIYAGPLRLLAHEIFTRFTAMGKPCALITGEEQRVPDNVDQYFSSCTVEMAPLGQKVDVAVIDEIQMIAKSDRGWAWTQAFLGIQAKELHLCGEDRAVDIIQALCEMTGDKCVVHRYERLNALKTMDESLDGKLSNLQKGDAVVAFSRVTLHSLKQSIENATGRRCAIVYGGLPPETRAQQASLFNDPTNDYDFLVASDAIGMGLNLEIKRVIFERSAKFDGFAHRQLRISEVKQIGGRAGRYKTASQAVAAAKDPEGLAAGPAAQSQVPTGFVTTMDPEDLPLIREAFKSDAEPIHKAGIMPPSFMIEKFYASFPPHTPLQFVLNRLREASRLSGLFELCDFSDWLAVAELIEPYTMSNADRLVLLTSPVQMNDVRQVKVMKAFAENLGSLKGGRLLDIKELDIEVLAVSKEKARNNPNHLNRLESFHKAITLYLWLSYRFHGVFQDQDLAFHVKAQVEDRITDYLEHLSVSEEKQRSTREKARRIAAQRLIRESIIMEGDTPEEVILPSVELLSTAKPEEAVVYT
ncbi:P-loop containing nucleoside triphosphate hydrolase protein [Podospora didyma]|uniref:RNA helicase n=1 Tax=Podospora didyma TaxID=330526 RepID=A0AAE0NZU4_9PEZI|nr:P-loop containing nucleoside triphosphate hydrolase protein [Podospora didyma]